ncbi:radical SAM/SPASM domain-containing protein [Tunicatimonas pelagia]|uniref:radical SAM/SPASM domain-containing protein n=1 Tax=Tunicatimonas pelagia TaxID=931531 RepID=UPI0026669FA9|nr:radical SAM protein [Tunicatimonas pelagia]WKN45417.1 radical SAM protein [Tunicatimonas pelagia]
MKRLIPQKAPELLLKQIDEKYGYAVNCSYPNSFRLLNRSQYEILHAINNRDDLETLSRRFGISSEELKKFLVLLGKTDLVRFDDEFSVPQRPEEPKSLNFWIHTTDACNLGCSYCYISTLNTRKGMSDEVRRQLLLKLTETVRKRGIKHIKLRLAGGEPLSQFKVWKSFIPEAKVSLTDLGCKLDVAFITNLTILSDDILKFSKEYSIGYGISLDGVEDTHDATRSFRSGRGSFQVVDANLRKLLAENIPVSVNTVISNHILAGLPELTRYLIALDVPFRYSIVKGESIQADLLEQYLLESYTIMEKAIASGWQFAKRYQFCDLKPNELGFQTCTSGFSGGAIYVDGSLKYCHVHFGQDDHPGSSIFNDELDLVDMIEQGEHHEEAKSEDCRTCRYRSVCTSGCPVYRVDGKDPQCSLYYRVIPMYYELQAKERLHLLQKHGMV